MVNTIYGLIWAGILVKWGDWKNWRKYYPTVLFFILGDFLYMYLLSDLYPMWKYIPSPGDDHAGITNTHISFSIMAIKYPATCLAYLAHFPRHGLIKKILYYLAWVIVYFMNELIDIHFHLIKYFNGWNLWWSALFNSVMFLILKLHFHNPLFAWIASAVFILFLWNQFDVPGTVFR
ncbi:hypothetical protein J7E38_15440 [Bacillus sp. ISL-35]|uniref:CBO0543 family protein n=1 Tax=Bacillus sp. ISL-35 TaxID=2819122 RepID=UPI001BE8BB99|nr:CBO0543 family protein [Bacillus sp. ISL-35]MBT2680404.1 hypothetical protein [Bacillus sp. ISL-35]MBT2704304.1 hypothetical protein [Chryseobacterium sp. ISL-80]